MELRRILCATDFSSPSLAALEYAKLFARKDDAIVHVIHVYSLPVVPFVEGAAFAAVQLEQQIRTECERALQALVEAHRDQGVRIEALTGFGPAADAIARAARSLDCDLVVVGTSGKTGVRRFLLGSIAERVVQTSPVDVLAVPAAAIGEHPPRIGSMLCAIDFSARSELALVSALELARKHDAAVHVVHVWERAGELGPDAELGLAYERHLARELEGLVHSHPARGVPVARHLRRGIPYVEIVALASELRVDLVVAGATGKSGLDHFLLGSVAERVVRSSPVPVLAVRPRAHE